MKKLLTLCAILGIALSAQAVNVPGEWSRYQGDVSADNPDGTRNSSNNSIQVGLKANEAISIAFTANFTASNEDWTQLFVLTDSAAVKGWVGHTGIAGMPHNADASFGMLERENGANRQLAGWGHANTGGYTDGTVKSQFHVDTLAGLNNAGSYDYHYTRTAGGVWEMWINDVKIVSGDNGNDRSGSSTTLDYLYLAQVSHFGVNLRTEETKKSLFAPCLAITN